MTVGVRQNSRSELSAKQLKALPKRVDNSTHKPGLESVIKEEKTAVHRKGLWQECCRMSLMHI